MEELALRFIGSGDDTGNIKVPGIGPGGAGVLSKVIRNGITIFIIIALTLSVIVLIWAAIDWLTSGGDKQKIQAARAKLTYAIIGLIVVFLAFFIVSFIGFLFRVPLTGTTEPSPAACGAEFQPPCADGCDSPFAIVRDGICITPGG